MKSLAIGLFAFMFIFVAVSAEKVEWVGGISGEWFTASNWWCNDTAKYCVPTIADVVKLRRNNCVVTISNNNPSVPLVANVQTIYVWTCRLILGPNVTLNSRYASQFDKSILESPSMSGIFRGDLWLDNANMTGITVYPNKSLEVRPRVGGIPTVNWQSNSVFINATANIILAANIANLHIECGAYCNSTTLTVNATSTLTNFTSSGKINYNLSEGQNLIVKDTPQFMWPNKMSITNPTASYGFLQLINNVYGSSNFIRQCSNCKIVGDCFTLDWADSDTAASDVRQISFVDINVNFTGPISFNKLAIDNSNCNCV